MVKFDTQKRLEIITNAIEDRKAENMEVIDLRGRTIIADYFVIASGTSNIHIRGIVDGIVEKMKEQGQQRPDREEGYSEAKWVLVDYGDVVVHVFAAEEREFYDLESLWKATESKLHRGDPE